jgi:hypothetical protein
VYSNIVADCTFNFSLNVNVYTQEEIRMADEKANEKADEKDQLRDHNEAVVTLKTSESTASSVASSLAGMFLEKQIRKGREIEIPSLGIIIGKENLRQTNGDNSHNSTDDKEKKKEYT